ncbi:Cupredoxin [Xylaria digitata]|nr:Cupredoxin [Xylaria digitata]
MQYSAVIATALLGLASAQTVHVVSVSSQTDKTLLAFTPNNIKANAGDMIQFQFLNGNHSVVQSNFDNPCTPIQAVVANATGMFSGYMDVAASLSTGNFPTYTVEVMDEKPLWLYCSQGKHCQAGMVMVVNENTAANATRSFDNYKAASANAAANLDPSKIAGGDATDGTTGGTTSVIPTASATSTSIPVAPGNIVTVSAWTGLLSIAAALALL